MKKIYTTEVKEGYNKGEV